MKRLLMFGLCLGVSISPVLAASSSSSHSSLAPAPYPDVPSGAWFAESVRALRHDGFLDPSKADFRPGDLTTRAEFLKMVLAINGTVPSAPPLIPSFDDVPKTAWYFGLMEEAAKDEWIRGDHDCYGTEPCEAKPEAAITRAQAAALLARVFGWDRKGTSIRFIDVGDSDWFAYAVYAAADRCILIGNTQTLRIRPNDSLTRAEMAVMLHRTQLVRAGENVCAKQKN